MIGGINTDLNGETTLEGIYASGEVAYTGVHGANRLASNSLLECLVFSYRAIEDSKKYLNKERRTGKIIKEKYIVITEMNSSYLVLKNEILKIMNRNVGIIRTKEFLEEAFNLLNQIDKNWDYKVNEYYSDRLRSLKTVSLQIINGAILREETRGSHIRIDFPEESEFPYNIYQSTRDGIFKRDKVGTE